MTGRILVPLALAAFMATPGLAQNADSSVPVIQAPEAEKTPQATDTRLQSKPATITPARKSDCGYRKQVMS